MIEVTRTQLLPGVHLTAVQTQKFKSSVLGMQFLLPLAREQAALHALLPMVLRRGTAEHPDMESLSAVLDELYGGSLEPTVRKKGETQCVGFVGSFLDDAYTLDGSAVLADMFGPDSPEARGSLSIYVVGGMVGTIYFGFMVSVIAMLNIFHPYALGMASGVGAGIMMASATASLTEIYPTMANQISALASASETISGIDGIYMAIFVGIPLCNFLYRKLEPTLGKFADRRAEKRAAKKKGEA